MIIHDKCLRIWKDSVSAFKVIPGLRMEGLRKTRKTFVSIGGNPSHIRTRYFLNTSEEHYRYISLLRTTNGIYI
jgi:hypothetical protein